MRSLLIIISCLIVFQPALGETIPYAQFVATLPPNFKSAFRTRSEDAKNATERSVSVFYYGKFEGSGDIVIVIPGGPGQDLHQSYSSNFDSLKNLAPHSPLVFFDPPGTGFSTPYPSVSYPFPKAELERFHQFGAAAICSDIISIGRAIGPQRKLRLVGFSYGAAVALKCLNDNPQAISSVFVWGNTMATTPQEYFQREYSLADAQTRFFADRPQLREQVRASLPKAHPKTDAFLMRHYEMNLRSLLDASVYRLSASQSRWESYARTLQTVLQLTEAIEAGSTDWEKDLVSAVERGLGGGLLASRRARIAINLIENFNGYYPFSYVENVIRDLKQRDSSAPLCGECVTRNWLHQNPLFLTNLKAVATDRIQRIDPRRIRLALKRYRTKLEFYVGREDHLMPNTETTFIQTLGHSIPLHLLDGGHDTTAFFQTLRAL